MSTVRTMYKKVLGLSFLLRQGEDFLLEIYRIIHVTLLANTPRKVKYAKIAQVL